MSAVFILCETDDDIALTLEQSVAGWINVATPGWSGQRYLFLQGVENSADSYVTWINAAFGTGPVKVSTAVGTTFTIPVGMCCPILVTDVGVKAIGPLFSPVSD